MATVVSHHELPFPSSEWHGSNTSVRSWYFDHYEVGEARPAIRLTVERQISHYILQIEHAVVPAGIEPWDEEQLDALDWTRGPALGLEDVLALSTILTATAAELVRLSAPRGSDVLTTAVRDGPDRSPARGAAQSQRGRR